MRQKTEDRVEQFISRKCKEFKVPTTDYMNIADIRRLLISFEEEELAKNELSRDLAYACKAVVDSVLYSGALSTEAFLRAKSAFKEYETKIK